MTELEILEEAKKARVKTYSPYSKFGVGAAALLKDGTVIHGTNIENASFGLSCCAERNCIFSLISQGYNYKDIVMFAIIGNTEEPISPCGACRQVLAEFLKPDTPIVLGNLKGDYKVTNIKELLPYAFSELENV